MQHCTIARASGGHTIANFQRTFLYIVHITYLIDTYAQMLTHTHTPSPAIIRGVQLMIAAKLGILFGMQMLFFVATVD